MKEEITLIHHHGLSIEVSEKAIYLFGEQKTAQIIMAIVNHQCVEQNRSCKPIKTEKKGMTNLFRIKIE